MNERDLCLKHEATIKSLRDELDQVKAEKKHLWDSYSNNTCPVCKQISEEIKRLKEALFEWMMHHWGLDEDDEVALASHSASFCWDTGLNALDAKSDEELRLKCLEHLKYVAEQAPKGT